MDTRAPHILVSAFTLCAIAACGDDDGSEVDASTVRDASTALDASPPADASTPRDATAASDASDDAVVADGGLPVESDAGVLDGGIRLPEGVYALDVCPSSGGAPKAFAVTSDGARAAYLRCDGAAVTLASTALSPGATEVELASSLAPTSEVAVLLGDRHVLYGDDGAYSIRAIDASAPAFALPGRVEARATFLEKLTNTDFGERLLLATSEDGSTRIEARAIEDGYATPTLLVAGADVEPRLDAISASGRTLVAARPGGYVKLRTNAAMPAVEMPFGPRDWAMGPVGLGDTHNFARSGDRLVRIELDTGSLVELVGAGTGLLEGDHHLLEREDAPGQKYAHFILDGDPARRIRDATEPLQILTSANATTQVIAPDNTHLLYVSDGGLFTTSATEPTTAPARIADVGTAAAPRFSFDRTSTRVAFVDGTGALVIAPVAGGAAAEVVDAGPVDESSVTFGASDTLTWLTGRTLRRWSAGTPTAEVAADVDAYRRIPNAARSLTLEGSTLRERPL